MSKNMSVDEIINQANRIKAESEKQLKIAEENLKKRYEKSIEELEVKETTAEENIQNVAKESSVKVYNPKKEKTVDDTTEEKVNIYNPTPEKTQKVTLKKEVDNTSDEVNLYDLIDNEKTQNVKLPLDDSTTKVATKAFKSKFEQEKTNIIKTKVKNNKSDLHDIPVIVASDHVGLGKKNHVEEVGEQITFDSFDDKLDVVPSIDEKVAEEILHERRKEKVGKFRLFGPDRTDDGLAKNKVVKDDYVNKNEQFVILEKLNMRKTKVKIAFSATLVLGALLFLMTIFKNTEYFPTALSTNSVFMVISIVIFIAIMLFNANVFVHGFNFKNGLNSDFPISITAIAVLVHTIMLVTNENLFIDNSVLLPLSATFMLFMSQFGKLQLTRRIIYDFEYLTDQKDKYTVENIANNVDSQIITRGLIDDDANLKTSVKTDFPTNFLEISLRNEPADKISVRIFILTLLLSIALFLFVGYTDNWNVAYNAAMCALCISVPACSLFLTNTTLFDESKILNSNSARVIGFEGAYKTNDASAIVIDAADLFGANSCDLYGVKLFNGAKIDDVLLYSAAIIIKTKGPLAHVFDDIIIGQKSILPDATDIIYEEKMGTSGWVYDKKVLVGNRELLSRHGVALPRVGYEDIHIENGQNALYVAVDGKIVSMFVVGYSGDPKLKQQLKKLEKTGLTVILKSCDPNINDESIARIFSLPQGFIRVMSAASARIYDKYSNLQVEKSPAYVVHNGSALSFISAMKGAKTILETKSTISFLLTFGSLIGFAIMALLVFLKGYDNVTPQSIVFFQMIWGIFTLTITKIKQML